MIGILFYKMLDSKFGSKVLQSDITEDGLKWTELGIGRAVFTSSLITFLFIYSVIGIIATGRPTFSFVSIVASLYFRVKMTPYLVEILKDHEKIIELEEKEDFKDSTRFKILKDIINTGEIIESIKRHTGESNETN